MDARVSAAAKLQKRLLHRPDPLEIRLIALCSDPSLRSERLDIVPEDIGQTMNVIGVAADMDAGGKVVTCEDGAFRWHDARHRHGDRWVKPEDFVHDDAQVG